MAARQIGRYVLSEPIATGGMATVHLGWSTGVAGFGRLVAIKRLLPSLATDSDFVAMLIDEARLASRIRHPNVVPTLDVVWDEGELLLVMDYVPGETLAGVLRAAATRGDRMPPALASAIVGGVLLGLHAAHEARDERGRPLHIVHRDVSPQNVILRPDGSVVVLDFGVARAVGRLQTTREGQLKGKLPYMAAEQLTGQPSDRRIDLYACAVVLWEVLTAQALFRAGSEGETVERILHEEVVPPSELLRGISPALDAVVLRGLSRDPALRFSSAAEMAGALEAACPPASVLRLAAWVDRQVGPTLIARAKRAAEIENVVRSLPVAPARDGDPLPKALPPAPVASPETRAEVAAGSVEWKRSAALGGVLVVAVVTIGAVMMLDPSPVPVARPVGLAPSAFASASASLGESAAPSSAGRPSSSPAVPAAVGAPSASPGATAPARGEGTGRCTDPFYLDRGGIRRVRRECLR